MRLFPTQILFNSPCAGLSILPHAVGGVSIPERRDAHNSWGMDTPGTREVRRIIFAPSDVSPLAKDLYNPEAREEEDFSTFFHLPPHLSSGFQGLRAQQTPIIQLLQVAEHIKHGGNAHELGLCTAPGQVGQHLQAPGAQHCGNHFTQEMSCGRKNPKADWNRLGKRIQGQNLTLSSDRSSGSV